MRIVWSEPALADLAHIREYIGNENPAAASRIAVQILAAADSLEHLPERGRPGPVTGTRELVCLWPYVIAYQIAGNEVQILRVWHGAQDRRPPRS